MSLFGARHARASLLLRLGVVLLTVFAPVARSLIAADSPAAASPAPVRNLVGLTKGDAIRMLGKPESVLKRGDREILMFANGARVEILNDEVVSYRADQNAMILTRGDTQYVGSDDGFVARVDGGSVPSQEKPADAGPTSPTVDESTTPPEPEPAIDEQAPEPVDADESIDPEALSTPVLPLDQVIPGTKTTTEQYLETGEIDLDEPPPPTPKEKAIASLIEMVLRLILVLAVVAIALKWLGLPFFFPDLIKACVFYVVVRMGIHALGGLGGMWEMLHFFRVADVVGFFALSVALFRFKVVQTGLTALKVAAAAAMASYFLGILLAILAAMIVFGAS